MAEKISTSMMPSQKSGTLMPKTTKPSVSVRVHRPPVAARMPSGTPTATASSMESAVSSKVTGRRCSRSSESGAWLTMSCPRSPRSSAPAQLKYCSISGRSRPSWPRSVATFSSVARKPSIVRTGSPGTSRMIRKTTTLMTNSMGIVRSRRRTTNTSCPLIMALRGRRRARRDRPAFASALPTSRSDARRSPRRRRRAHRPPLRRARCAGRLLSAVLRRCRARRRG